MTRLSRRAFAAGLCLMLATGGSVSALADAVILTITAANGAIKTFTAADIAAMKQSVIVTGTPWTKGVHKYAGPSLAALLAAAGVSGGGTLEMKALNDYKVLVPMSDVVAYHLIVAFTVDGQQMLIRDKGPLWLIYPLSSESSTDVPKDHARMIWQLKAITVQQ